MLIDIHTHVHSDEVYLQYRKRIQSRVERAIVMHWFRRPLEETLSLVKTHDLLSLAVTVDPFNNLESQLNKVEELFKNESKVVGMKLYAGYQPIAADDKRVIDMAKLCARYKKPLTIHSGDVYDPHSRGYQLSYSRPIAIDALAVAVPECPIIIAHFGFPYFLEVANIVNKNKNVYTDVSGTITASKTKAGDARLLKQYVADLQRAFDYYPKIRSKVMFGTDYSGENYSLRLFEPYITLIEKLYKRQERSWVFRDLAAKLFFGEEKTSAHDGGTSGFVEY